MTPPPSDHFNGKTFFYPGTPIGGRFKDFLRWRRSRRPTPWPQSVDLAPQPPPPAPRGDEIVATWIGHATWLLQTARGNILTDPQFSPCAGPLGRLGPRRVHAPGVALAALPRIDVVLLSHDHYDHCDLPSLSAVARAHAPLFVAPLRHADLLTRAGARRVVELDWWQAHAHERGVGISLVPSKHWANRLTTPRNHRLWGGFVVTLGSNGAARTRRIWFGGDSGYDRDLFREIGRRQGPADLALLPIGAYEPRWFMTPMHMNPTEAVAAHRDAGVQRSLAMHWGTFQLTDEGRDEPVQALAEARAAAGMAVEEFAAIEPGASVVV
jgi:L-ascorbate metabolism protein UlaG (beta-lactamase superfamily)